MDLIKAAIMRPVAVLAVVIMVVMFGFVALRTIPIQLAPDVTQPVISVETRWPGASPIEVEREILNLQEEELAGIEGLREIIGQAQPNEARIDLEFRPGTDMDKALLLVANRLDRVSGYPLEADEPTLETSGTDDNPIAWFVIRRIEGNDTPVNHFGDFVEDNVKDMVERVPGVSRVDYFGGSERELRVTVIPDRLAQYRLTVPEVVRALREANIALSAGEVEEGKRRYVVRVDNELKLPEQVSQVVLRSAGENGRVARVQISDVAKVEYAYKSPTARIRVLGEPTIPFRVIRENGANVIETMAGVRTVVEQLNAGPLKRQGLYIRQVYDETIYINSAIDLVIQNIYVGGILAATVLMLFLRSAGATLVVSLAIPVSVIGAFVGMAAMGRSLNVVSLAGIAFAVGMVVDAAIVVLENIFRLRQAGYSRLQAAYEGTRQVYGAILVSALTTIMVFIPILTMELEVGQLFRDIAVAISVAVTLSLLVAVTVVPALARRLLGASSRSTTTRRIPVLDDAAAAFKGAVTGLARRVAVNKPFALILVAGVVLAASVASWALMPKLEYLPEGNRNLVFGVILPPPGYNLETTFDIAAKIENATRPFWASEDGEIPDSGIDPDGEVKIRHFFFVALDRGTVFLGASALQNQRAGELIPILRGPVFSEPGTFGFITQPSLFGRSVGGGRSINLDITGPDLEQLVVVAQKAAGLIGQVLPREDGHQIRPLPGLELGSPEVRVYPDPVLLEDNGITASTFADTVDAFNDGIRVAEITSGNDRIDLTLRGPEAFIGATQGIDALPVVTTGGRILPVNALGRVEVTAGPTEIRHYERQRTITLEIRPANQVPLEAAMDILRAEVIAPLREDPTVGDAVRMSLSGTADKLTETWNAMVWQLLMAVVIVYLVMAVLFEDFLYPMVILLTVPLASAGGLLGLGLLNRLGVYQPLDMLTLLGFVVLVGVVVNNAILLAHQTRYLMKDERMSPADAIVEATGNRVRPIFMSTLTSLFGMLPLVLFPGAGSELYRGLGTVVIGGLALSAVLTLIIIPPLLSLVTAVVERRAATESGAAPEPAQ